MYIYIYIYIYVYIYMYIYIYSIKQYYINYTLQQNTVCLFQLKVENYPSNSYTRSNKGRHVIYCTPCQA